MIQKFNNWLTAVSERKYTLWILLGFGLVLRLLLFFNTTVFEGINESTAMLNGLEDLKSGKWIYIYQANYPFGVSYVAYFFEYLFGSFKWFFVFQCLLSTLTLYFVYLITLRISSSKVAALISLVLATIYMDYALVSTIIYNQAAEVFFTTSVILLSFKLVDSKSIFQFFLWAVVVLFIAYISLLFKATLKYYYWVFLFLFLNAVLNKKNRFDAFKLKYLLVFVVGFYVFNYHLPENYLREPDANAIRLNEFIFFGHTDYGGNGGEGTFVYPENEERFNNGFAEYQARNNITEPTIKDANDFRWEEIIRFITEQPFSWVLLQLRKIVYEYGAVPVRDSLQLLLTGRVKLGLPISALIIQATYAIPILLFFLFFRWSSLLRLISDNKGLILLFVFLYTFVATTIYGHYQERYRILTMVSCIIPLVGIFYSASYLNKILTVRRVLVLKIALMMFILSIWAYQGYEAFAKNGDRMKIAIEKMNQVQ